MSVSLPLIQAWKPFPKSDPSYTRDPPPLKKPHLRIQKVMNKAGGGRGRKNVLLNVTIEILESDEAHAKIGPSSKGAQATELTDPSRKGEGERGGEGQSGVAIFAVLWRVIA